MKKTYYSAVVVGAVVESKIADAFKEKCKPASTDEVIEAFICAVIDGELKPIITKTEADHERK